MKFLVQLCRIIVGVIFIISGFVKAVDPIGFSYKLEEYFAPDVFNIGFLHDLALPQATFFSVFEILLGVLLLLGIFRKFTTWSLLLLIVFFTFLTFYSAYFNKVTDCGCFGDAMKLTPWQSFWKDIFLLVLILILFVGQKYIKPILNSKISYAVSMIALVISGWISYTGIQKMPIIDFRAYAVGKNLIEGMKSAEELGLTPPQYQVIYHMKNKNTGEVVQITDTQYVNEPKWYEDGTPWEIQSDLTESKKIADGYEPPIHDFEFDCEDGDLTDFYLEAPRAIFFVTPFASKLSPKDAQTLSKLFNELSQHDIPVIGLTNSDLEGINYPYCFVDQITLKTITRNNPGILVLKKGTVVGKFHNSPLPSAEEILKSFE